MRNTGIWTLAATVAAIGVILLPGVIGLPESGADVTGFTATFTPVADAYVDELSPGSNYGGLAALRTDAVPIRNAYLRFDVRGVGTVVSATLRIFAETDNQSGFDARGVSDNSWGELTPTYNNAPSFGAVVGSSGGVIAGSYYAIDVSSLVSGDGLVSLALTSSGGSRATRYSSREGTNPPQSRHRGTTPAPGAARRTKPPATDHRGRCGRRNGPDRSDPGRTRLRCRRRQVPRVSYSVS